MYLNVWTRALGLITVTSSRLWKLQPTYKLPSEGPVGSDDGIGKRE